MRGAGATGIPLLQTILEPARAHGDTYSLALGLAFLGQAYLHTRNILAVWRTCMWPMARSTNAATLLSAITAIHQQPGSTLVPALQA